MSKLNWGETASAVFLLCAATAIALAAQTFTTLHSFDNTDGADPYFAALIQASDGRLYGTTEAGGAYGGGTVFMITRSGTLTTLYSFCSQSACTDGSSPLAGLVQATDGNFYGTTGYGGAYGNECGALACGTVFKITPSGTLTTLHSFCSQSGCTDGEYPTTPLIQGTDGNFYGTTVEGGANDAGTVFKITPSGALTTLHSFDNTDGYYPGAALLQAADGNFYGTMVYGGANDDGTVFKITPKGTLTTLYNFCSQSGCADGFFPEGLVQVTEGTLFGITNGGGANGLGTVFKITPSGMLTTLYSFCSQGGCSDGLAPNGVLIQATDGNFYGTTAYGGYDGVCDDGTSGCGTVYRITPSGTLTTLRRLCSESRRCIDGSLPVAGLVEATNGSFYGTTNDGGTSGACSYGCGTVFGLSVGLGPFVETQPAGGKVGAGVRILGTNLSGASSVTFNGTAAVFKVVSGSLITTTVPAGATTGKVQVVTPSGTLSSNVNFRVAP